MTDQVNRATSNDGLNSTRKVSQQMTQHVTEEYVVVPPDGGWGWIVAGACFLCILISDGILFCFGLIMSELERVFEEPAAKVAWVFSIVNGISLVSGMITLQSFDGTVVKIISNY